jgi:hypothetical protein
VKVNVSVAALLTPFAVAVIVAVAFWPFFGSEIKAMVPRIFGELIAPGGTVTGLSSVTLAVLLDAITLTSKPPAGAGPVRVKKYCQFARGSLASIVAA